MKAQVYFDNPRTVRLFRKDDDLGIADLRLDIPNLASADESLHRIGLRRNQRWRKYTGFFEAQLRKK